VIGVLNCTSWITTAFALVGWVFVATITTWGALRLSDALADLFHR
jgi:hypothetical protein